MTANRCIVCLELSADGFEIFSEIGKSQGIAETLSKHFWFKVIQSIDILHFVCADCWIKTQTFHEFYRTVENAHKEFFSNGRGYFDASNRDSEAFTNREIALIHLKDFKPTTTDRPFIDCEINSLRKTEIALDDVKPSTAETEEITRKITLDTFSDSEDESEKNAAVDDMDNDLDSVASDGLSTTNKEAALLIPSYFDMNCDRCEAVFKSYLEARKHYRIQHNNRKGYIKCCGKRFDRSGLVNDHIRWHQNPNCFKCKLCNKSYNSRKVLNFHMSEHNVAESEKFKCDKCERRFRKKFLLNSHIRAANCSDSEVVVCHLCQKRLKSRASLKTHIAGIHESASQPKSICEICAKVFKTKSALIAHLPSHDLSEVKKPRVQCKLCGSWLKTETALRSHIQRTHNSIPLQCPQCDRIVKDQFTLSRHILGVHGKPSHHCTLCDKSFTRARALKEHIASHTGENLYTCSYCPKAFRSLANKCKHHKTAHADEWNANRKHKP